MTVLEETGKLTGKDIHKVREVQVEQAAAQIDLPVIPELPDLDTLWDTNPATTTTGPMTVINGPVSVSREKLVAILEGQGSDSDKIGQIRLLVGLDADVRAGARSGPTNADAGQNGGTLAQRSRRTRKADPARP